MPRRFTTLVAVLTAFAFAAPVMAQYAEDEMQPLEREPLALDEPAESETVVTESTTVTTSEFAQYSYMGVDDFFNIREANSNVKACEWQFELTTRWSTYRSDDFNHDNRQNRGERHHHRADRGVDDDIMTSASIKYGITDDLFVEVEVLPINFGDGNNIGETTADYGSGETNVKVFWQFLDETDSIPAMALWGEARLPTGCNSEKLDGTGHLNITKTLCPWFRVHLEGWVKTANGARGDGDRVHDFGDRRHFQWGAGPGMDFKINDCNLIVVNWLNKSSEHYGHQNNNLIEAGWVYRINECHQLRVAAEAEPHNEAEGAHWSGKVQWSMNW